MADPFQSDENRLAPKARKLSRFLAQQLLYDYVSGELDPQRHQAMEDYLKSDPEAEREHRDILLAVEYTSKLSKTRISQPQLREFKENKTPLSQWLDRLSWSRWPEFMRWGTEALGAAMVVAVLALFVPWDELEDLLPQPSREVILAEIDAAGSEELTGSPSEDKSAPSKPSEQERKTEGVTPAPVVQAKETTKAEPKILLAKTKQKPEPVPVGTSASATKKEIKKETKVAVKAGTKEKALKGQLVRLFMKSDKVDEVAPLMVQELEKLGAKKAGQVPLGWRKPDGSYFHFTAPSANNDQLMSQLRYFGPVRRQVDPHWRVMPEGTERYILWVEEK